MRIKTEIYPQGGIDCLEENCPHRQECANHTSAGDFRMEGGNTPDLFEENGIVFCRSQRGELTKNRGMVVIRDGKLEIYSLYED